MDWKDIALGISLGLAIASILGMAIFALAYFGIPAIYLWWENRRH